MNEFFGYLFTFVFVFSRRIMGIFWSLNSIPDYTYLMSSFSYIGIWTCFFANKHFFQMNDKFNYYSRFTHCQIASLFQALDNLHSNYGQNQSYLIYVARRAISIKVQLISEWLLDVFIWTQKRMKIFLYFCPTSLK